MLRGGLEDTICAIATPAGEGGIGIVRLSGPGALHVASTLVRLRSGRPMSSVASHRMYLADIVVQADQAAGRSDREVTIVDEALIVYMKAPHSYTGEDTIEIQSHGGPMILSTICRACLEGGARQAEPGEFTKRAFVNGRLDLSQAEGVLDTIKAKSFSALTQAHRQLRGELGAMVAEARDALIDALAQLEAGIDFVEEDISFLQRDALLHVIRGAVSMADRLLATAKEGRLLRDGARVVIVGRPNVGKSSLLNRLLREERAIVTPIPGTTRDVIEEWIDLDGLPVCLVDTAGLRDTDDPVEREGIARTRLAQVDADLTLIVLDGTDGVTEEDRRLLAEGAGQDCLVVVNKLDLVRGAVREPVGYPGGSCGISAVTGLGLDDLKRAMKVRLVGSGSEPTDGIAVTNLRHATALRRCSEALHQAEEGMRQALPSELIAVDVRAAADALGEITGTVTNDEILAKVFADYCIGK